MENFCLLPSHNDRNAPFVLKPWGSSVLDTRPGLPTCRIAASSLPQLDYCFLSGRGAEQQRLRAWPFFSSITINPQSSTLASHPTTLPEPVCSLTSPEGYFMTSWCSNFLQPFLPHAAPQPPLLTEYAMISCRHIC